jgi:hypothetical protein
MIRPRKVLAAFVVIAATANLACAQSATGITADLAKKCREEALKAHPTPKAGSKASGAEKAQRDFFQACISKGADKK